MPYRLELGEPLSAGMRRLMLEQVALIAENLTSPEIDRETGIHNARKCCKRLRAAYRLLRGEIGRAICRRENYRFRDISRSLAGPRDAWVRLQTLDALTVPAPDAPPLLSFGVFRQTLLDAYRETLSQRLGDTETVPRALAALEEARRVIATLPIERETFDALRPGLRRTYRRGRRAMAQAYALTDPARFHEWRKRVKDLWHQIEILENCWPAAFSGLAMELHALSDYLGDDHDLEVLRLSALEMRDTFASETELSTLLERIAQKRLALEECARPLGERLYRERPKVFTNKVEACFKMSALQEWHSS
jgi:CHAD domain-containing protein